jgi:hypothetical protein
MYVDDGTSNEGDIKVEVDGQEYDAQANVDLDADGIADGVMVHSDTGMTVYADSDHDGIADKYAELDSAGNVTASANFDAGNGQWVDVGDGSGTRVDAGHGEDITVDTPKGETDAGPATIDSDDDGHADTAVVDDGHGGRVLFTDSTGDGKADVSTEMGADGQVSISRHTGTGEWTEVETGHIDSQGQYQRDPAGQSGAKTDESSDSVWAPQGVRQGIGTAEGVVRIDARTGQWISPN